MLSSLYSRGTFVAYPVNSRFVTPLVPCILQGVITPFDALEGFQRGVQSGTVDASGVY